MEPLRVLITKDSTDQNNFLLFNTSFFIANGDVFDKHQSIVLHLLV